MKNMLELFTELLEAHHAVTDRLEEWLNYDGIKQTEALYEAEVVFDGISQLFKKRLAELEAPSDE